MKKKGILITATASLLIVAFAMFTGCALFSKTWKYFNSYFKSNNKALIMNEYDLGGTLISSLILKTSENVLYQSIIDSSNRKEVYYELQNDEVIRYTYEYNNWTVEKVSIQEAFDNVQEDSEVKDISSLFNSFFYQAEINSVDLFKTEMLIMEKMCKKADDGWYVGKPDSVIEHISFKIDKKTMNFIVKANDASSTTQNIDFIYDIEEISIPQEALDSNPYI